MGTSLKSSLLIGIEVVRKKLCERKTKEVRGINIHVS